MRRIDAKFVLMLAVVLAFGLSLVCASSAFAAEAAGSEILPPKEWLGWLLSKWWGLPLLVIGGTLVVTKFMKVDLSKMVLPIAVRLLTWMLTPPAVVPVLMAIAPPPAAAASDPPK